jgi:hypothetical protein
VNQNSAFNRTVVSEFTRTSDKKGLVVADTRPGAVFSMCGVQAKMKLNHEQETKQWF